MSSSSREQRVFRVSELNALVKLTLESQFPDLRVLGEVSGVTLASSGHLYFTLKDEGAAIRVVMFRSALGRSTLQKVENGQQVVVRGVLSMYPPRGEVQLVAQDIQLKGIGDIYAALERLKRLYQEKGYFDPERKRKLPLLPKCIGVVTSPTGAAVRDILRILERRFPEIEVVIYPAKVQGEGAALEIAAGIEYFNTAYRRAVDVLIVGRGGGSYEDLWAFNEEAVVEAIYRSRIPVISAVGHEIDFTIADFVADLRAPTPSAAAEMVVGRKEEFIGGIDFLRQRLSKEMENLCYRRRAEWMEMIMDSAYSRFPRRVLELSQTVDSIEFSLARATQEMVHHKKETWSHQRSRWLAVDFLRLAANRGLHLENLHVQAFSSFQKWLRSKEERFLRLEAKVESLNPESILGKGYSITSRQDGQVVRDAGVLREGEDLDIRFHRGRATATVKRGEA